MTSLLLSDLPPPPVGKTGWPWTEVSQSPWRDEKTNWPRISIITPSYNQGQFIEETIRSVLLQGYPNLEYIVIDGGSSDGSVEIIKKFEKLSVKKTEDSINQLDNSETGLKINQHISFQWVSEPDSNFNDND